MADILLGLAGTGTAAEYHARHASLTQGFRIQSVTSRNKRRAMDFALGHGIPKVFDDIEYLFEGSDIDFLVVANETVNHFRYAQDAFERGLGVIVETPCARTLRETKALVETAEEEGAYLFVANPLLDMPSMLFLSQVLSSKTLGSIKSVSLSLSMGQGQKNPGYEGWRLDPSVSGGPLFTEASMTLELLSHLFGTLSLRDGKKNEDSWMLDLRQEESPLSLRLSSEDQKYLRLVLAAEEGVVEIQNNTLLSWPSCVPLPSLPDGLSLDGKTMFSPYDHLGATYRRIHEAVESGVGLDDSFFHILQAAFLLEQFQVICSC